MAKGGGGSRNKSSGGGGFSDMSEKDQEKEFDAWGNQLSDNDMRLLDAYQSGDFGIVNNNLRNGKDIPDRFKSDMQQLDQLLSEKGLSANTNLYRVADSTMSNQYAKLKPGDTYTEKGYMSTSFDKKYDFYEGYKGNTYITIQAPKGTKGGNMNSNKNANEDYRVQQEFLLNRNTKFTVKSSTLNPDGSRSLVLEII